MKSVKNISLMHFLLFSSLLLFPLLSGCENSGSRSGAAHAQVRYQVIKPETVTLTQELPGRISAFRVSEVRPQVGGIIQKRIFDEGMNVEAGQVLYQIDPALYKAAFNNAKANLKRAQASENAAKKLAERRNNLVKDNAVSKQDRDDAIAAYNKIRAEIEAYDQALESAAINLSYTRITAPVSGRIGRSFVTEGALVTQNQAQPLAVIQQISPVYVDVTQSSRQLLKIRRALASGALKSDGINSAKVRLYLEDGRLYKRLGKEDCLEGELLFSDITVDENTGSVTLRAKFDNPDGLLLPGMFIRAELIEGVAANAILIPQRSVTRDARNRPQVFVLTPHQDKGASAGLYDVAARTVLINRDYDGRWLITEGLKAGDLLLVDGIQKVRAGQVVAGQETETAFMPDTQHETSTVRQ